VCARLGVALPTRIEDLTGFYQAWCEGIPFDSVSKAVARREETLPPGGDPADLVLRWLETGLGGLCWGHTSSMGAVLEHAGVRCRVGLDRMIVEDLVDVHSFLVVEDGDQRLALDVVHCSRDPLPIRDGERGRHPVYPVWFEADGDRLQHVYVHRSHGDREPGRYALLSTDLDASDLRMFCEVMRTYGMRVRSLYHRRFTPTEMRDARPNDDGSALVLTTRSADGVVQREVRDPDEAFAALGYGPAALDLAVRGGLVRLDGGTPTFAVRPPH
jgi:arylamine N-acetyltransferase